MSLAGPHSDTMPSPNYIVEFGAADNGVRETAENVSVSGVMLLSAIAVTLAILGAISLGAAVIGIWWLVSHIPVPPVVWHLLAALHLT
jgi:hypothetical protein